MTSATTLPLIVSASDLGPPPVVHQLVQERAVRPVFNDHYLTGRFKDTPKLRARIAEFFMPPRSAIALESALWVYAGGPIPHVLSVLLPARNPPLPQRSKIRGIRTDFDLTDIAGVDGIAVTTKERTVVDLARWCDSQTAREGIRTLAQLGADLAQAKSMIGHKRRNCVRAHELVNAVIAGPVAIR